MTLRRIWLTWPLHRCIYIRENEEGVTYNTSKRPVVGLSETLSNDLPGDHKAGRSGRPPLGPPPRKCIGRSKLIAQEHQLNDRA